MTHPQSPRPTPLRDAAAAPAALPPHDVDAEEAIIAAVLLDDGAVWVAREIVGPEDFFREQNAWIFEAALALADRGEDVTLVTVAHELARADRLDQAGGEPYLVEVAGKYFTAVGADAHARIVWRDATYRRLIGAAQQITQLAYAGGPDLDRCLEHAWMLVDGIMGTRATSAVVPMAAVIERILAEPEEQQGARITTGYRALDRILRGFAPGQMTAIGARSDNGKTSLMTGMALREAWGNRIPVLYLPLEDSRETIVTKMVDGMVGMSWDRAHKRAEAGKMHAVALEQFRTEWRDYARALDDVPLFWPEVGRTPTTIEDVVRSIQIAHHRYNVAVVYLDYIDMLTKRRHFGNERLAELYEEWLTELKAVCVHLDVHVVFGSQVSNPTSDEERAQIPPPDERLRNSGAKREKAQNVVMIGLVPGKEQTEDEKQPLRAKVTKVKGDPMGRFVRWGDHYDALYLDRRCGAVRELEDIRPEWKPRDLLGGE